MQSPYTDPKTVVVLGDSTALTLGAALAATAPPGISVANGGLFGCGLAIGTSVSNDPPQPQLAMFPACNQATPVDQQWPAVDTQAVAGTAPGDVVLFVAGAWEVQDILRNGQWTNIEQPSFQRYELSQMRKAVEIATAHGAHLDFTTLPALAAGAAFGEAPFPEDSSGRRLIYDHLISEVAAEFPGSVSVIDYGRILSPRGVYTEYLDGVQVRTPDGIHTPAYAPGNVFVGNSTEAVAQAFYNWLSPRIWPLIIDSNAIAERRGRTPVPRQCAIPGGRPMTDSGPAVQPGPKFPPRPSATGKERITSLDGLRAVALLIIMGYHFGVGWLQGGFFSLDIFYVLSGYLITGLLVSEYRKRSRIKLSAFWLRRARRLLPALLIVLVAVTLMVRFAEPAGLYPDFRMSALSALFYFSNWWQIADQRQLLRRHRRRSHRSPTPGHWPWRSSST